MTSAFPWAQVLAVAGGAAVGAVLRWAAGLWLSGTWSGFPLGTLFVNCLGGLLVGAALLWFERAPNELLRLLLVTGFLGGLTTFSAFSAESLLLLQRGHGVLAASHTLAHVVGALVCALAGYRVAQLALG